MPNGFVGDRVPCPNSVLYSSYSNSCIEEELIEVRTAEKMFSDPSCTVGSTAEPEPEPEPEVKVSDYKLCVTGVRISTTRASDR